MRFVLLPLLAFGLLVLLLARPPRRREGLLLAVLVPLLALAGFTAYEGRSRGFGERPWLNLNECTAEELADFTAAPPALAKAVISAREALPGGAYRSLGQVPSLSWRSRRERAAVAAALAAGDARALDRALSSSEAGSSRSVYPELYARWARAKLARPKLSLAHSPQGALMEALGEPDAVARVIQRRRFLPVPSGQDLDLASISAVHLEGLALRDPEDAAVSFRTLLLLLLGGLLAAHAALRLWAPATDNYLLPAFGGLGTLSTVVIFGASSPLTDPETSVVGRLLQGAAYQRQGWAVLAGIALMAAAGVALGRGRPERRSEWLEALEKGSSAAFLWVGLAFSLLAANAMARAPLLGALGLLGVAATLFFGYRAFARKPAVTAVLIAIAALFLARTQESGFNFLYIEGSKLALILFMASFCARHEDRLERRFAMIPLQELLAAGIWYLGCLALVFSTGDLGFLLLLWLPAGLVASLALRRFQPVLAAVGLLVLGCALTIALSPLLNRLLEWRVAFPERWHMLRDPFAAASDQMANALYRIASTPSLLMGTGLGNGHRPEAASDLNDVALPFYFEQLGLLGVTAVVLLFALLLWRFCRVGVEHPQPFGRWLALTSASVLGVQTLYMLGANAGLLPLTGLTLAPVASGAWGAVATGTLAALALGLSGAVRPAPPGPRLRRMLAASFGAFALVGALTAAQYARLRASGDGLAVRAYRGVAGRGAHGNARLSAVLGSLPPGELVVRDRGASWDEANLRPAAWNDEAAASDSSQAPAVASKGERRRAYLSGTDGEAMALLTGVRTQWGEAFGNERALEELLTGVTSESLEALKPEERRRRQDRALLAAWRAQHSPLGPLAVGVEPQQAPLTVIRSLQRLCYTRLKQVVRRMDRTRPLPGGAPRQAVLAIVDVRNGDYLAAVQLPSYDPSQASRDWRLLDHLATSAPTPLTDNLHYTSRAPGSVAKINTVGALLQARAGGARRWRCVGGRRVQGLPVACMSRRSKPVAHGLVGPREILKYSCNEGAAQAAAAAGPEALMNAYLRLGARGVQGALADPKSAEELESRFRRYTPWIGYGQTIALSVDEVVRSVAAIANGGHLVSPHWRTTSNAWSRRIWRPEVARTLASWMAAANERGGTAYVVWKGDRRFPSKTGTAQATGSRTPGQGRKDPARWENDAWFVTFGPYDPKSGVTPRVALVLWVQAAETRVGGRPIGTGGMTAAEVGVPALMRAAIEAAGGPTAKE